MPASVPRVTSPWETYPGRSSLARSLPKGVRPRWAAPDPAAVSGPPWPALVAGDGYTPPRLIRWPIIAGLAAVVVYLVVSMAVSSATSSTAQSTWRDHHATTIQKLAKDETALLTDESPAVGDGQRLVDWKRFESDVAAASALPNPGGSATTPWREMLNDYATASNDVVTALTTNDTSSVSEAEHDLAAGVAAARQFDQAIGISSS